MAIPSSFKIGVVQICYAAGPRSCVPEFVFTLRRSMEVHHWGFSLTGDYIRPTQPQRYPFFEFSATCDQTLQNGCTARPDGSENRAKTRNRRDLTTKISGVAHHLQ